MWPKNIFYMISILFNLLRLVLDPRIVSLSRCSMFTEIECVICSWWGECFVNVKHVKLVDSSIKVFYILTDFTYAPSITNKGVLKSSTKFWVCLFWILFFWSIFELCLLKLYYWVSTFMIVMSWWIDLFFIM